MKNFKIIKYQLLMWVFTALLFNSCNNDLNEVPYNPYQTDVDEALGANLDNYTAYLSKLYGGLAVSGPNGAGSTDIQGIDSGFGQYVRALFMCQEVPTDEAILGWTSDVGVIDMSAATFTADNPFINAMYQRIMYQVAVCNEFLRQTTADKLSSRGVSSENQLIIEEYRAEARFLRALSYWHGLDIFGKMSFVSVEDPVDPGFKPREISPADLFTFIEDEAMACTQEMAASHSLEYGRADQTAAWMLLAKLYLNAEVYIGNDRYSDAKNALSNVVNSGYSLANVPYSYMFLADNNMNGGQTEFILPVISDGVNLQSYGSTTFLIHASVGGDMNVEDFGIDFGWAGLRTRPEFVNKFEEGDNRAMFFTEGQNLSIANMGEFTDGYAITKFKNLTSHGEAGANLNFVDTDFPMFRLSDAYLMYAESILKTGGSPMEALNYVNPLRVRAGIAPLNTLTLDNIYDERARELFWEGHRRTDLRRAKKYTGAEYIWEWKGNAQAGTSIPADRGVMPIPNNVLITNPNLNQNTGY